MCKNQKKTDQLDEDLYEEFDDEELDELLEQERLKALEKAERNKETPSKRRFPRWAFWMISAMMLLNVIAIIPQTFSVPAIDFLITSAKLSVHEDVKSYKKAVAVIETDDSKGTGFAVDRAGTIITNYHVVEGEETVTASFAEKGMFTARVADTYPEIDIAILEAEGNKFPFLELTDQSGAQPGEKVKFIGNPLNFNWIANEGTIVGSMLLNGWEDEVMMMKAPVYRGNSGSPVINQDGKVTGIIFATLDHQEYGKVGLFVPVHLLDQYADK